MTPSAELISILEEDSDRFMADFYAHFFALAPDARGMFPANMVDQRQILFQVLEYVLETLYSRIGEAEMIAFLSQLGRDHRKYGVTSAHYKAFSTALVKEIIRCLDDRRTPAMNNLITQLITLTAGVMDAAAQSEAKTLPPYWEATVVEHIRLGRDHALIRLEADGPLPYAAGQYISVQTPQQPGTWRYLSPTMPADPHGLLEFNVKAIEGGAVSPLLVSSTRTGDRWRIGAPHGSLHVDRESGQDVLMVAGGTGIAPLRALILEMCKYGHNPRVHLFYGAKYPGELTEMATLWQLSITNPWLTVVPVSEEEDDPWWLASGRSAQPGNPHTGMHARQTGTLADIVTSYGGWSDRQILISGAPGMIQHTMRRLVERGAPPAGISYDPY
ncbi:FAD-binding oxidoreductase [Tomitella biformata]|uniref:FAD-binding oxidoreductase n=1 Tax=Tomitella biformata TaxID=630403 RepID=UPI000467D414|nr:FAD-binding oxidoreductase [Tomitella biformata]